MITGLDDLVHSMSKGNSEISNTEMNQVVKTAKLMLSIAKHRVDAVEKGTIIWILQKFGLGDFINDSSITLLMTLLSRGTGHLVDELTELPYSRPSATEKQESLVASLQLIARPLGLPVTLLAELSKMSKILYDPSLMNDDLVFGEISKCLSDLLPEGSSRLDPRLFTSCIRILAGTSRGPNGSAGGLQSFDDLQYVLEMLCDKPPFESHPELVQFAELVYRATSDPKKNFYNLIEAKKLNAVIMTIMPPSNMRKEDAEAMINQCISLITGLICMLNEIPPLDLADAFNLPRPIMEGILALARGNVSDAVSLGESLGGFDEKNVEELRKTIKSIQSLINGKKDGGSGLSGLNLQGMSREEIFAMADKDQSGTLDFDEFKELLKYFGMVLSDQSTLEMFATADKSGTGVLNYGEFEFAMDAIEKKLGSGALNSLGLSTIDIAAIVVVLIGLITAIFIFIFMGISAFTTGSAFGTVINSVAVLGGGGGAGSGEDFDPEKVEKQIEDKIESVMERLSDV